MLAELDNSLGECVRYCIEQIVVPSGSGHNILTTGTCIEIGLDDELKEVSVTFSEHDQSDSVI